MQLKSLFYVGSLICVVFSTTTQGILNDLNHVRSNVITFDNAVKFFQANPTSIINALNIHSTVAPVQGALNKTITDANSLPTLVALPDGNSILAAVSAIVPIIEDALSRIIAVKSSIQALGVLNLDELVNLDLNILSNSTTDLENALFTHIPSQLIAEINDVVNELSSAFTMAIATYTA